MKTFRKRFFGLTGAFLLAVCIGSALGAGVNGIFTTVNSINGYKLNGSAGTSGQVLCSDGTYFDTPCTVATIPAFTGTSGYQLLPSGLILEWGATGSFDTGPDPITFPLAFPNAVFNVTISQKADGSGCSTTARSWMAYSLTTSGFNAQNDGTGCAYWQAIGY